MISFDFDGSVINLEDVTDKDDSRENPNISPKKES